jgi:hypothetical protein
MKGGDKVANVKFINNLVISQGHDKKWRVRLLAKPHTVLKEKETYDEAYRWAHGCRKYSSKEPPWAPWELEFLAENYGRMSREEICRRLNRSPNAQKIKAYRRFRMNMKTNIYTARSTARELGISCAKIIVAWHDRGYLHGKLAPFVNGPNHVWHFEDEDIIECLRQRPYLCNPKRMPQSYFRSVVREEWDKNPWYNRREAALFLGISSPDAIGRYITRGWLPAVRRPAGGGYGEWIIRHSDLAEFQVNDPRPDARKSATLASSIDTDMQKAMEKAFVALARGRFQMFGYWASVWTHLNALNKRVESPFQALVDYAKMRKEVNIGTTEGTVPRGESPESAPVHAEEIQSR